MAAEAEDSGRSQYSPRCIRRMSKSSPRTAEREPSVESPLPTSWSCVVKAREVISLFESRLSVRKRRGRRGYLSTTPQSYNLWAAGRFGCQINGERSWIAARALRCENHRQRTTPAGSEGKGTVVILRIIARHHDLADEIDGS